MVTSYHVCGDGVIEIEISGGECVLVIRTVRDMTIDELIVEVISGAYSNDDVHQYVLGYDNRMFDRAKSEGRVVGELREELHYMTEYDFRKLVKVMGLPVRLEVN